MLLYRERKEVNLINCIFMRSLKEKNSPTSLAVYILTHADMMILDLHGIQQYIEISNKTNILLIAY